MKRREFIALVSSAATAALASRSFAQTARKSIHIIVGFPAGGGTDVTARVLAESLRGTYAPTVIVENRPGASARLAVEYVKNAEPDGNVMLFTPDFPMTLYPHSFKSLSYDPLGDFTPVGPTTKSMLCYNVGPAVPASFKTLAGYLKWAKTNPDKAAFATTSAGATPHFAGVMLANEAQRFRSIPCTTAAARRRCRIWSAAMCRPASTRSAKACRRTSPARSAAWR